MALTRELIEITFGNAITQAKVLDACADDMERLASSNMKNIEGEISAAWQGANASNYLMKMDNLEQNIIQNANQLRSIANSLRRIARIFRETELRAIDIAKTNQ